MKTMSDLELLSLMSKDNKQAFDELYRRYKRKLCRSLYKKGVDKDDIDDLIQDVFIAIWNQRDYIKITTSVSSYMYSVATHKVCNYIRAKQHKRLYEGQTIYDRNDNSRGSEIHADLMDIKRLIKDRLKLMTNREQHIFKLSRFKYMSIDEISKKTNISKRTVENYLHTALKALRPINDFYINQ